MNISWDELIGRIHSKEDLVLFEEAVNSAKANALRMAYVAIWLSCAESFKRKFKEASSFDHEAAKVFGNINAREQQNQSADKYILTEAHKYGFISQAENLELVKIYELRCIFGHPYEQSPILLQVEAAATIAVEYVLSQPLKLRKGFLSREADNICGNVKYLDLHYPAIENYAQIVFSRSSEDCHHWFLEKIWKESEPKLNDPTMSFLYWRIIWFSQAFLRCVDGSFFQEWNDVDTLTKYPFVSNVFLENDLFQKLSTHAQDIAVSTVLEQFQYNASAALPLQQLNDARLLNPRQAKRFEEMMRTTPPSVLASAGILPHYYYDKIIEQLKSYNWYTQEDGINAIRNLGPRSVGTLTDIQQKILGNNVLQAAEGDSRAASSLLDDICNGQNSWPPAFIEGIITECVINDENQFRFKTRKANIAMSSIIDLQKKS